MVAQRLLRLWVDGFGIGEIGVRESGRRGQFVPGHVLCDLFFAGQRLVCVVRGKQ